MIKSSGDTSGELHIGSCSDAAGIANAMGLKHSSMTGANDFMICANTDGATFVSAKDTKTLTLSGGGNHSSTRLELRDATLGFRFNVNKANVDLQYSGDNATSLFYIDASTDSVGINTATPSHTLAVSGDINAQNVYVSGTPAVKSDTTGITGASGVSNLVYISSGDYAALSSYDSSTIYFIR